MQIWLGVENFAKIESARVCIDNYTLFVGPNNSGKTFLMQLIQGMGNRIAALPDEKVMEMFCVEKNSQYSKFIISNDNISKLIDGINEKLYEEKENIIRLIFGKDISIEKLYIDISMEDNLVYEIYFSDSLAALKNLLREDKHFLKGIFSTILGTSALFYALKKCDRHTSAGKVEVVGVMNNSTDIDLFRSVLDHIIGCSSLFLPASRTGLLLLYRDYFANKTDGAFSYQVQNGKLVEGKESRSDLTKPIYEFLRFLQTYSENANAKQYEEELQFFNEHLIEGHIHVSEQGSLSYHSGAAGNGVPMYLASSMVNEIVPIALAINSMDYERLIIDEVEASLHPEKQIELVRFFNRLSNKGMKLIISTHSDTFVSKLNNLYILSEKVSHTEEETLEKVGLEKEDLIDTEKLFVYEFISQPNGKSIVKEIKGDKEAGYQFDLFTGSAMRLYDEAIRIGEIQKK